VISALNLGSGSWVILAAIDELSSLPAFAPERSRRPARLFLDLVAVPMLLRALVRGNLKVLDAEMMRTWLARCVLPCSVQKRGVSWNLERP